MMHACTIGFPDVPSDAFDNLCGALGRSAEMLTEDLNQVTCTDCLRAIAEWGLRQGQAACGLAFDAGRLWWLAAVAVTQVNDWLGMASTRAAADDCLWRLKRALEGSHFGGAYLHDALHWRGEQFHSEERAGFRVGPDGEVRRILPGQKPWEHAAGPTLAEEVERLRYERDALEALVRHHLAGETAVYPHSLRAFGVVLPDRGRP